MSEPIKKPNQIPESYRPGEKPEIIEAAEEKAESKYKKYKDIEFFMERESYPETFKMAGVPWQADFGNIGDYHNNYKDKLADKYEPYTDVGLSIFSASYGNYIFGGRVNSLDDLPDGMVGVDTGIKNFAVITFRADDTYKLLGGTDGPGDAMKTAGDYIKNVWLPEHKDEVEIYNPDNGCYMLKIDNEDFGCGNIEVYKNTSGENPEMCFYIPLKENRISGKRTDK